MVCKYINAAQCLMEGILNDILCLLLISEHSIGVYK